MRTDGSPCNVFAPWRGLPAFWMNPTAGPPSTLNANAFAVLEPRSSLTTCLLTTNVKNPVSLSLLVNVQGAAAVAPDWTTTFVQLAEGVATYPAMATSVICRRESQPGRARRLNPSAVVRATGVKGVAAPEPTLKLKSDATFVPRSSFTTVLLTVMLPGALSLLVIVHVTVLPPLSGRLLQSALPLTLFEYVVV